MRGTSDAGSSVERPVSPLRQRLLEDMAPRDLLRADERFSAIFLRSKDLLPRAFVRKDARWANASHV